MTVPAFRQRRQRHIQRFVVGLAMSVVAFVLDRVVARAIKRGRTG
jgi:hypothetical protein